VDTKLKEDNHHILIQMIADDCGNRSNLYTKIKGSSLSSKERIISQFC